MRRKEELLFGVISSGVVVLFMLILGIFLLRDYQRSHRTYTFWWAVAFWLGFLAALLDFISYFMHGWNIWQYRLYLFAAATLVAYMGAGTVYLFSKRVGRVYVMVMSLIAIAMLVTLTVTPVVHIAIMPEGEKAQGFVPSQIGLYFALLSGIGALAVFVGAIYSFVRSHMVFNLWIALGALLFSIGGTVGNATGIYEMFYLFQALGAIVLYYGIYTSYKKI